ncbi:allophanate hydrolase [Cellulomonas alba]|uniref:Allophanate hydrolase n=1 Tax=Cellulomonas alba TaxID=3053467 RepID=A0ABT7SCJ8_9CELL|nr:allophanate hydrolase [Cellulomonas alba]MDM7853913.1 allophanate hydrolase [Cellulomonas alba]
MTTRDAGAAAPARDPRVPGTARERVERAYARLAEVGRPEAWITLRAVDDALRDADEVDAALAAGRSLPLAGTVFAVKDNIDVAGLPTTAASPTYAYVPEVSATAVRRLVDAGAVVLGKTNLDQFATGLVGTRSPYGVVRGARFPERVSGGSSSGSAVVTALGVVDFALATDTAGSGRVPAALNGIVGIKTTLGLVPTAGVVPACPSYDATTVLAPTLALAVATTRIVAGPDPADPHSRTWPDDVRLAAPAAPVVGVPPDDQLELLSPAALVAFHAQVDRLVAGGARTRGVDISAMLACARLLYDGALVAERYASFGAAVEAATTGVDPVVAGIVDRARGVTAADLVRDQQRVLAYRLEAAEALSGCDVLLLPTAPCHPTIAEVEADPVGVNSRLGTFTNFVNLLDLAAVSVPALGPDGEPGVVDGGLFGVTVVARAFDDQVAIDVAARFTGESVPEPLPGVGVDLVVFGAHMAGLPLHGELEAAGARFVEQVSTAPRYRMVALPGSPARPGVHEAAPGAALAGELWRVPPAGLGTFLAGLRAPMTLGPVELADGRTVVGFGCARPVGEDITHHGGWRAYLAALAEQPDERTAR